MAIRIRDQFLPKAALQPDQVSGTDLIMQDAIAYKFMTAPLSKEQLAKSFKFRRESKSRVHRCVSARRTSISTSTAGDFSSRAFPSFHPSLSALRANRPLLDKVPPHNTIFPGIFADSAIAIGRREVR